MVSYYEQKVNHFDFVDTPTFSQRYILSHMKDDQDVLLVYTGNEGDIWSFYNNTGFIFTLADELNALVLFIEHRYYGNSIILDNYKNLNSINVLVDFVEIIQYVAKKYKIGENIICVGGSYGGMLCSYLRMKYPHIVKGALASSAPNLHFQGLVDPYSFGKIIKRSFMQVKGCDDIIRNGFITMDKYSKMKRFDDLNSIFNTCQKIESVIQADKLIFITEGVAEMVPCLNYPYKTSFFSPLPAYPVKYICERMKNITNSDSDLNILRAMFQLLNVYYNYSGKIECIDLSWNKPILSDRRWRYQRCVEFILPIAYNQHTDFFLPHEWNLKSFATECRKEFPYIFPNAYFVNTNYHGKYLQLPYSNIIFSNGELDPWSSGGIEKENIRSDSIYSITIKGAAHHLDLREPNENDPPEVIKAREIEISIIKNWIAN